MGVKTYIQEIQSSPEDKRRHKGLILDNNLKVMLISDPTTDKSAAALDVHIGSMSDPEELPGLAHFCEHMLFMGTEKYTCENTYNKYLSEHGGCSNAFTSNEHTNYYFDVTPSAYYGALDRFAQFFISPLFAENSVEREVKAVHSEYEKNLQNDLWRLSQLEKSTSDKNHDFSKFGMGSKDTLDIIPKQKGICVRNALLEFHKKWYSANTMGLAVLGKESLEELEKIVVELFSPIQNKDLEVREWLEHPLKAEHCAQHIYVVPVKDIRNLNLTFPIPDLQPYYKTSPGHYLSHLIGHEGQGSLLSYLKEQRWVNSLVGGQRSGGKGFGFFMVNVDLTEEGMEHTTDIVTAVFQYLNLLRQEGPHEWIFNECRDIDAMTFRFKDKEQPVSYVSNVAQLLHYYPVEETLSGGYLKTKYDPDIITNVLDSLTPEKIRVSMIAKSVEKEAKIKEKWFGTAYNMVPIEDEVLEKWKKAGLNDNLQLPDKNHFVPTDFELKPSNEDPSEVPLLVCSKPLYRIWHKQDKEFNLPKAVFYVELFSPIAYADPHHANLLHMLVQLFRDSLTEYSYAAELAGLYYTLMNTKYGLTLSIKGYNDKLSVLLEKIIDKLITFKVDKCRFEILKEAYVRSLKNFYADQPHHHVVYYMTLVMGEKGWSKGELLGCVEDLTSESLERFLQQFLAGLHLEFLVHGNLKKEEVLHLCDMVALKLATKAKTKPLLPIQFRRQRECQLPIDSSFTYNTETSIHHSSAVAVLLQLGMMETPNNMLLEMIVQVFNEPAFNQLRTKEQLGYIVWCSLRRAGGTQGLRILIQGEHKPQYLDNRIEAFLYQMKSTLEEMSDEDFLRHREALSKRRLERPKKLSHLTSLWWTEIVTNQYHFHRDEIEVAHLQTIAKEDVVEYFKKFLCPDSSLRRKLSVQVHSTVSKPELNGQVTVESKVEANDLLQPPTLKEVTVISDISSFKSQLPLHPLKMPHINITLESDSKAKL